jgi:hypothetical protein
MSSPSVANESTLTLLWESCRRDLDSETLRTAAAGDVQASLLVAMAEGNRTDPLLWRALDVVGRTDVLGDLEANLRQRAELFRHLLHPQALAQAVSPLTAIGLEPVVMKGPAVARHYPEPGLRPMDDLDLLLPPSQHRAALDALSIAGWRVVRAQSRDWYDTQLVHPDLADFPLELHFGLQGWHERTNRLDALDLWTRRQPIEVMGVSAFGFQREDDLVYLAAHAGKPFHGFDRLIWLVDLAMLDQEVDWERVQALAADARCTTVVTVGLRMATRMGLRLPERLFGLPAGGWRSVALQPLLQADWLSSAHAGTFHIRFALVDSYWRRAVLLVTSPHRQPWSERLQWPIRTLSRTWGLWRAARRRGV